MNRPLYILPFYPFRALWVAWMVDASFMSREGTTFCTKCANTLGIGILLASAVGIFVAHKQLPNYGALPIEFTAAATVLFILGVAGWAASQNLKAGYRYAATLQILAMAAALIIGYESVYTPIKERDEDSTRFFAAVHDRVGERSFVVFEESVNEAVWYLDRPFEIVRRPDLKERFFDKKDALMLAPLRRLDPELRKCLRVGEPIMRGKREYVLADPNPLTVPDPSVFVAKSRHGQDPVGDD
jgi:hypothetical protein